MPNPRPNATIQKRVNVWRAIARAADLVARVGSWSSEAIVSAHDASADVLVVVESLRTVDAGEERNAHSSRQTRPCGPVAASRAPLRTASDRQAEA
jgi:hypothetical protein